MDVRPPRPQAHGWKRAGRIARVLLTLAALAFVVVAARSLAKRWEGEQVRISIGPALLCLPPLILGSLVLAWGWKKLLERMSGRSVPTGFAIAIQLESQLARYMPGKVGVPLIRMGGAARLGASARVIGVSVIIETLSLLSVGGVTAFAALLMTSELAGQGVTLLGNWGLPVLLGFGLGTVLLLALDRRFVPASLRRFVDDGGHGPLVPMRLPLFHVAYWATWLLHGYLVSRAVGAGHAAALTSSGVFVLAPILGFLALATPAGLGVREAVLAFALAPAVGTAPALGAAVASRAASLIADVTVWLMTRRLGRR
jgi:hypothetical protein